MGEVRHTTYQNRQNLLCIPCITDMKNKSKSTNQHTHSRYYFFYRKALFNYFHLLAVLCIIM